MPVTKRSSTDESSSLESEYAVDPDDAIASQFYVTRVVSTSESKEVDVGDTELLLDNGYFPEGDVLTWNTGGSQVPVKEWEVISEPFDCPPFPHVLALQKWVKETKPDPAWSLYSTDSQ